MNKIEKIFNEICSESEFGDQGTDAGIGLLAAAITRRLKGLTLSEEEKEFFLKEIGDTEVPFFKGWLGGATNGVADINFYNFSKLTFRVSRAFPGAQTVIKKLDNKMALLEFMLQQEQK